ncbi:hypothetical protein FRC01_005844 [Tulasnella sp. 417]|nr:hypothetical protein FRC01_005844 [Tulasnella sp. 417]
MQLSSLFIAVIAAVGALAQQITINTPQNALQCIPTLLTWSGGAPPFTITVVPAGQASAAPLVTVGPASGSSITWNTNLPEGDYTLVIRDSFNLTSVSGTFQILRGSTACMNSSVSVPVASSPAASSPAASSSAAATSKPASASVVSSSAAAADTTSHNAASSLRPLGIAGLLGLAGVAALF